jgi:hypothetical protein
MVGRHAPARRDILANFAELPFPNIQPPAERVNRGSASRAIEARPTFTIGGCRTRGPTIIRSGRVFCVAIAQTIAQSLLGQSGDAEHPLGPRI